MSEWTPTRGRAASQDHLWKHKCKQSGGSSTSRGPQWTWTDRELRVDAILKRGRVT